MLIEERISHVQYALERRETILKSKIDRRFPVSVFAVDRRVSKVEEWQNELELIKNGLPYAHDDVLERLEKIEEALFGGL